MILDELIASTRAALAIRKAATPLGKLLEQMANLPQANDILPALNRPSVGIIAEVKRASPSRQALNISLDPAALAADYALAGASAISVLTEPTRFLGKLEDLASVRQAVDAVREGMPLLRKDFIIDAYQIYEARVWGADMVLLITAALPDQDLDELYQTTLQLGMVPLVEVHNEGELARVKHLAPQLIGINNRDLDTFAVDVTTTIRLLPLVPGGALVVSESGIHTQEQMRMLAQHKANGVLIGEALVTAPNPGVRLHELLEAGVW